MTKYIISSELIYYASRLTEEDAFHVLTSSKLKQTSLTIKSSKTDTKYEKQLDDIQFYTKPLYLCPSYIHDPQFTYIGFIDYDFTIKPSDFSQIEDYLKQLNVIPIFESQVKYKQIFNEILNSVTFKYTTQNLNHKKYFDQYKYLNDVLFNKLKTVIDDDTDLVWSQDISFSLFASKFKNSIQDIHIFNELIWCVPFFEKLIEQFLNCKVLNFQRKNDIEIFERVVKQIYFDQKVVLPILNFSERGINISVLKHIKMPSSNIILVPNNNLHCLMCCEKYRNKYKVPIDIYILGTVIDIEILKYLQYLNCKIVVPENDDKFNELLNSVHINFVKEFDNDCLYLNKHVIENSEFEYEIVADEIYKKLHFNNSYTGSKAECQNFKNSIENISLKDSNCNLKNSSNSNNNTNLENNKNSNDNINKSDCCEKIEIYSKKDYIYPNNTFEDVKIYKSNVLNSLNGTLNIEYKGKKETPKDLKYLDAFKYKKVITENEINDKYLRQTNDSTLKSRLVEPLKINTETDWMCQILNTTINAIVLDYDGTLVNICENPEDAVMGDDVRDILTKLNKHIKVVISTGRSRECMDKFVPQEIEVFAEHCSFRRHKGEWTELKTSHTDIKTSLEYKIALFYQKRTPNSHLELKSNGFVFHYRKCDPMFEIQAKKLYYDLLQLNTNNIKLGKKIVEYQQGSKSDIFNYYNNNLLIAGDDVTDEDMFDRKKGVTIKVGYTEHTKAEYFVENVEEFIEVLNLILAKFENVEIK